MAWQLFDTTIVGNQSQVLPDDHYLSGLPGEELPNLAWCGVWCQQDTEGHYCTPDYRIEFDIKPDPQWPHTRHGCAKHPMRDRSGSCTP